ncbi:cysteine desulfurase CsdA [Rosenbergiella australiborealis]|uniref:cysteine desulfurase CsdA n=1 Tax=Rosenbergiella australiborealis TaxID=1544696 RepID=UPI001F4D7C6E|nr:cysteine desulfurase CsdA [Rosenbergiella australiborealis]
MRKFSPEGFRHQFPALRESKCYLDSAATSLCPQTVIDATHQFYQTGGSVHRSHYLQAKQLTERYEACRQQVAELINAPQAEQIIWTRGSTESINLVAQSWLQPLLHPGDEIIVSELEHHANLLPWLMLAEKTGAKVVRWPITAHGELAVDDLAPLLTPRTRLLAVTQMSNVTGYRPPLAAIIHQAHEAGVAVVIDGAQGIVHQPTDVQQLDADFYLFSAHKLYGPTGIGILYARSDRLAQMRPVQGGGKMITHVDFNGYRLQQAPWCFEPGTPNTAGVIGLSSALDFHRAIDWQAAEAWTCQLAEHAVKQLAQLPGIQLFHAPGSPIISFVFEQLHSHDLFSLINEYNVALRVGQHCAQPLMQALGVSGTLRASFAAYNAYDDVEQLVRAVTSAYQLLTEEE